MEKNLNVSFHPQPPRNQQNSPKPKTSPKIFPFTFKIYSFYLIKLCKVTRRKLEIYFFMDGASFGLQSCS